MTRNPLSSRTRELDLQSTNQSESEDFMRVLIFSIIIIFNFLLSTTWLQGIAIGGIMPNIALIILVCYALLRDDIEGAIMGFFMGLLADMLFGNIIGVSTLLMTLLGYFAAKPFREFFKENYIAPLLLVGASTLAYEFLYYVVNFLLLGRTDFWRYLVTIILPTTVYNLVLCIFIYRAIYAINNKLEDKYGKI